MSFTVSPVTEVPPWKPTRLRLLYEQLAEHIAARIDAGDLQPGQRLPPQKDLATEYGVAYHTVRSAVGLLEERGYIVVIHGGGTYVAEREAES
jgi:DNA-binding GntR family transcriptional regulator